MKKSALLLFLIASPNLSQAQGLTVGDVKDCYAQDIEVCDTYMRGMIEGIIIGDATQAVMKGRPREFCTADDWGNSDGLAVVRAKIEGMDDSENEKGVFATVFSALFIEYLCLG